MNFNSFAFAVFLPIVFLVYWLICRQRLAYQNIFLLVASYLFYGWWDWRFLGLLAFTTLVTWGCSLPKTNRALWTTIAVITSIAILCFFKYFGFFGENLKRLFDVFGFELDWFTLEILLPVGISFYTFQAISYSVDVFRGQIAPCRNPLTFALYVSFFPQLVAGPIERSTQLLPQLQKVRKFDYIQAVLGMRLILWGLFKKCVVADGLGILVDLAWPDPTAVPVKIAALAVLLFPMQLYADFSGYSDIAKGSAALLGVRLMNNFTYPYFALNAKDFWRRWHRSLMQWFTQYVYIPIGGSRRGNRLAHVMVVFLLSGFWHGASWTFVLWGILCGFWYIASDRIGGRKNEDRISMRSDCVRMAVVYICYMLACIAFRAPDLNSMATMVSYAGVGVAFIIVGLLVLSWLNAKLRWFRFGLMGSIVIAVGIFAISNSVSFIIKFLNYLPVLMAVVLLAAEWHGRKNEFALQVMPSSKVMRSLIYVVLYLVVLTYSLNSTGAFIYFKF